MKASIFQREKKHPKEVHAASEQESNRSDTLKYRDEEGNSITSEQLINGTVERQSRGDSV